MLLNLCTIILPFLLSCTNRRCANLPRMSMRAYGSMKRKKESQWPQGWGCSVAFHHFDALSNLLVGLEVCGQQLDLVIKSVTHEVMLNFFCFLLPYQNNFNCFFG